MRRSITRWTTSLAATALLGLPAAAIAQTSSTSAATGAAGSMTSASQDPAQAATPQVNQEAARRHLTEARNTLSQLTQLPAAAQLSGEARSLVSQLIANFNELITAQSEWRGSYSKVDANLVALLGPDNTDAERTGGVSTGTTGTTGTAGTVGTSGSAGVNLDPAIRGKLVELRQKLNEFEKAAGGSVTASGSTSSAAESIAGTTASMQSPTPQTATQANEAMGHQEAMRHIAAIEAILNANAAGTPAATTGRSGTTGSATAGTTTSSNTSAGLTLTSAQLEQLRTHLAELKRLMAETRK